ncbi:MAG: hypothetical protein ACXVC6_10725 [Bacteroidia bacterium]
MKKLFFVALTLFSLVQGYAQHSRRSYGASPPPASGRETKLNADTLNAKIKTTVNAISKNALSQANANYIQLENGDAQEAIEDLKANMPYDDFIQKYACRKTEKGLHVTRFTYKNKQRKTVTEFTSTDAIDANVHKMSFTEDDPLATNLDSTWIFKYYEKTDLFNEVLQAFYFTEEFYTVKIPNEYNTMVTQSTQYADTMQAFLKKQKDELDQRLLEAKQMEAQWLLLSNKIADNAIKRKRREMIVSGLITCLPVLLLSIK